MGNHTPTPDTAVLAELGARLTHLRLQRNLTQADLAHEAGVSKRTVIRLENGESSQLTNLIRVVRALGLLANLDAFIPPPRPSPLVQLRLQSKDRRRASGESAKRTGESKTPSNSPSTRPSLEWTWGDEVPTPRGER